jgi:hypothetical protein
LIQLEDLFDPLAHALADRVARPIGGAQVERRAIRPPLILRHVGVTFNARQLATNAAVS